MSILSFFEITALFTQKLWSKFSKFFLVHLDLNSKYCLLL